MEVGVGLLKHTDLLRTGLQRQSQRARRVAITRLQLDLAPARRLIPLGLRHLWLANTQHRGRLAGSQHLRALRACPASHASTSAALASGGKTG